jgi:hypothetical protein
LSLRLDLSQDVLRDSGLCVATVGGFGEFMSLKHVEAWARTRSSKRRRR